MLCIFCSRKLAIQTTKRKRLNTLIFERNYLKRFVFYRAYNKHEEHKYLRSGLTQASANVKTIFEKQKGANTNKKMATDLNTLLHSL